MDDYFSDADLVALPTDERPSHDQLKYWEETYCSHGDTVHYNSPPKMFSRCEGSFVYDDQSRQYLDLQMWYSAVNVGYANPRINRALKRQADILPQLASQFIHREKIELSARLAMLCEEKFSERGRIHFNVGGAQAVEDSLKLVRNASEGKSLCFAFEGGYHGRTLGASSITSSFRYRRRYGHFSDRAHFVPFPYCFRCPYSKKREDCDLYCLKQFKRLFDTEYYGVWDSHANKAEYAAFYVETIQGTGGYVIPPEGYLEGLQKILKERDILLVDDEVQMGFFRTGKFWAAEHFNIKPDILVFGKSLTNGLNPLSGVWAREELINPQTFPCGSTHSTFSSNPLGTAAGLEMIKELTGTDYEKMVMDKGAYFLDGLKELQKRFDVIGDVDGLGLALRVEICGEDGFTPNKPLLDKICELGLSGDIEIGGKRYGLVLDVGGYYKNVITLAPALTISYEEIDLGIALLGEIIHQAIR